MQILYKMHLYLLKSQVCLEKLSFGGPIEVQVLSALYKELRKTHSTNLKSYLYLTGKVTEGE